MAAPVAVEQDGCSSQAFPYLQPVASTGPIDISPPNSTFGPRGPDSRLKGRVAGGEQQREGDFGSNWPGSTMHLTYDRFSVGATRILGLVALPVNTGNPSSPVRSGPNEKPERRVS